MGRYSVYSNRGSNGVVGAGIVLCGILQKRFVWLFYDSPEHKNILAYNFFFIRRFSLLITAIGNH